MPQPDTRPLALANGSVVHSDPEIHSGVPVFVGSRVPVRVFLDYIEAGHSIDEFVDHFPSVRRERAIVFLQQAFEALLTRVKVADISQSKPDMTS
ncbi:MAG TPA: DUF433 domain-containing protein [Longimicrobium sp.]|nr:DUF433 domain-containing protein [Longimicrobium sp.]